MFYLLPAMHTGKKQTAWCNRTIHWT